MGRDSTGGGSAGACTQEGQPAACIFGGTGRCPLLALGNVGAGRTVDWFHTCGAWQAGQHRDTLYPRDEGGWDCSGGAGCRGNLSGRRTGCACRTAGNCGYGSGNSGLLAAFVTGIRSGIAHDCIKDCTLLTQVRKGNER